MQNKSQNYKDVFEKSNILNNKANSSNMSSAKKNEEDDKKENGLKSLSKVSQWHDGLKSGNGFQRLKTMANIASTLMTGGMSS